MKFYIDITLSAIGLVLLSPIFALVAIGLKLTSPGPVFFRQERMGLNGASFRIVKFRTMQVQELSSGSLVTAGNDSRITAFGKILRRYKLDELPQLLNVVRGEMALVGPRPEVPEFAGIFPTEYERILKVRPGITHPATLAFRREEEILAQATNPSEFYIQTILPRKLAAYEANLEQSLAQDILTIVNTIIPTGAEKPLGPEHFNPSKSNRIIPFPTTVVENIPGLPIATETIDKAVIGSSIGQSPKINS